MPIDPRPWPFYLILLLSLAFTRDLRSADNELTAAERRAGWILLFDGQSLNGWMTSGGKPSRTPVQEGCINPHGCGDYIGLQDHGSDCWFKNIKLLAQTPPAALAEFFTPPEMYRSDLGHFRSPLAFADGTPVHFASFPAKARHALGPTRRWWTADTIWWNCTPSWPRDPFWYQAAPQTCLSAGLRLTTRSRSIACSATRIGLP